MLHPPQTRVGAKLLGDAVKQLGGVLGPRIHGPATKGPPLGAGEFTGCRARRRVSPDGNLTLARRLFGLLQLAQLNHRVVHPASTRGRRP